MIIRAYCYNIQGKQVDENKFREEISELDKLQDYVRWKITDKLVDRIEIRKEKL